MTTRHIVMFSGGICSWAAAKRVAERHGTDDLTLLFTDTLIEDEDLYRFLEEAAANVGGQLVRVAEGRDPWQVFRDEKMIGNSRVDLCSRILKRDMSDHWLTENCDPLSTVVYLGIDWTEQHRFDDGKGRGARNRYAKYGWQCEAPMTEPPYLDKAAMLATLKHEGLLPPRMYAEGFPHNNCGGFCIKAGHAHFAHLLKMRPAVYRHHEEQEAAFPGNHTILRDRSDGATATLSLRQLRERIESNHSYDLFDWGGCGCFTEAP